MKILYKVLTFFVLIIVLIVIALNSSWVIKKVADKFAPEYKISYNDISGNVFTGIKISGLKFDDQLMVENIKFAWNPSKLLYKRVAINELIVEEINVDVVKALIASFPTGEDNSTSEPFPLVVLIDKVYISLNAFEEENVLIRKTDLKVEDIKYTANSITIESLSLHVDTNITNIVLEASLDDGGLEITKLIVDEVDTVSLEHIFLTKDSNSSEVDKNTSAEVNATQEPLNPLIPSKLLLKEFKLILKARNYKTAELEKFEFIISNLKADITHLLVENAEVKLNILTNLSNISQNGMIKDNHFEGNIRLTPNKKLFELYELPLRKEAIGDIIIDLKASKEEVTADIRAKAKHILVTKDTQSNSNEENATKEFNLDIDSLLSHVVYSIENSSIKADTNIMVSTPFAKDVSITNVFTKDKNISYLGTVKVKKLVGIDAKLTKPINNLLLSYVGDVSSVKVDISSSGLNGKFISNDFKKALLHLETSKKIVLREMLTLPAELNSTEIHTTINIPLDFEAITPLKAKVKVFSNVCNLDIDVNYAKAIEVNVTSILPESSLLKRFDKNVKWDAFTPMVINAQVNEKNVDVRLSSKALKTKVKYILESGEIDGQLILGKLLTKIQGIVEEKVVINSNVNSIKSLLDNIQSIYTLESLPKVKGALDLSVDITQMKEVDLRLSSPKITYRVDRKTEHEVKNIEIVLNANESEVVLKSYKVTYDKMNFFATKPSKVSLEDTNVLISPIWLNDSLQVVGEYNLLTKKGSIDTIADSLHFSHEMIDLDTKIALKTVLNAGETDVQGDVTLLGAKIKYDMSQKTFASDSDIIIVQDIKKESDSAFMNGLSLDVKIKSKKPLVYNKDAINIKAKVDLTLNKAKSETLMVLGSVEILKGGTYIFEDKKFIIGKSFIYFTGDPNKPILDISIKYKSLNHLITIGVTGTPEIPNISFSSKPSLTREEILSVILFDSEGGAGTNSGDDMMKMMGGAMAKSALSNMGVQLDHLVLGTDGSVEVGKRITDKIMFIYINGELPQVKVKYYHSPRWESVISADEESESYDIVYKRDFSSDDISFSR